MKENIRNIKLWAFLVVPIFAVIIGAYFTIQEIKRKDSPEIFSQDEIKSGIRKNFPAAQTAMSQNSQSAQAGAQNPMQGQDPPAATPGEEKNSTPDESAPSENSEENSFSFAIFGDSHLFKSGNSEGNFQKAVKEIEKLNPDKVFSIGDLVSSCNEKDCEEKLNSWKTALGASVSKFDAIQGNNDRTDGDKSDAIWQKVFDFPTNGPEGFSELAYSSDFKNSHFIFLDSEKPNEHKVNSAQRDWLEKDLADNKKDNTFVFFHEPAYPTSSKIGECLDKNASDRNALWKILDSHNVTAVFSGRENVNSRKKIDSSVFSGAKNSLYQFIVGNTDATDDAEPKAGVAEYSHKGNDFMLISVKGKAITAKVYSLDGTELNSFDFSK
jgi:3',5'-cyclic-AMP phosphodiesterase